MQLQDINVMALNYTSFDELKINSFFYTEAWWHIGRSFASYTWTMAIWGSIPGKGENINYESKSI